MRFALVMLAACASAPRSDPTIEPVTSGYCASIVVKTKRGPERFAGCAETAALCAEAYATANRWGSSVNVVRVSPCERSGQ